MIPKYIAYQEFRKKFGEDGNLLVIGLQTTDLFSEKIFNEYIEYFRRKECAGISIGYKEVLFLLPKCQEADEIFVIK